jgi:O-antigen/teichoic acid export membrane protein
MTPCEVMEAPAEAKMSDRARPKKLASVISKNTIFGVLSGGTQVATRLVTVPIVIAHIGLGGYGIWSIIMTTAAYMRFGTVGVKSAFQKYVAEATGTGDYNKASELLSTGCAAILTLSVVGLIPVAFFSQALARSTGVPAQFLRATSGSISVLALIMVLSNVGAVYEAILLGSQRIDVARRFGMGFTLAEACAIVVSLHYGYGLFTMATIMGVSEIGYVACCMVASRRVMPQIHVAARRFNTRVLQELFRFAGSYQLVNLLQVLYAAILPVTMLRAFGADYAGIYALSLRLISPAQMLHDSFLLSILSGGSMLYASGAVDRMGNLIHKSFKVTLTCALIPLSFIACFGANIIFAWTGQNDPHFRAGLALVSLAGVFQAVSILGLVLYRISGNALLDNLRQVLVIVTLLAATMFARQLGFYGVLGGLACAELIGMLFMIYAVARTFPLFRPATLLSDLWKAAITAIGVLAVGGCASFIPLPAFEPRVLGAAHIAIILAACGVAVWPLLRLTKLTTTEDGNTVLNVFFPRRAIKVIAADAV